MCSASYFYFKSLFPPRSFSFSKAFQFLKNGQDGTPLLSQLVVGGKRGEGGGKKPPRTQMKIIALLIKEALSQIPMKHVLHELVFL